MIFQAFETLTNYTNRTGTVGISGGLTYVANNEPIAMDALHHCAQVIGTIEERASSLQESIDQDRMHCLQQVVLKLKKQVTSLLQTNNS